MAGLYVTGVLLELLDREDKAIIDLTVEAEVIIFFGVEDARADNELPTYF